MAKLDIQVVVTCEDCFSEETLTRTVMQPEDESMRHGEVIFRCPTCKHRTLISVELDAEKSDTQYMRKAETELERILKNEIAWLETTKIDLAAARGRALLLKKELRG